VKGLIKELPSRISALQNVITGEKVFNPLDHGYDMGGLFSSKLVNCCPTCYRGDFFVRESRKAG
jgi:hypothetical protein